MLNPDLHVQTRDPTVLLQNATELQPPLFISHSSMSKSTNNKEYLLSPYLFSLKLFAFKFLNSLHRITFYCESIGKIFQIPISDYFVIHNFYKNLYSKNSYDKFSERFLKIIKLPTISKNF